MLSVCSGMGSPEKALERLEIDYELVGFSEVDKWAEQVYCLLHNVNKELNLGDIQKIDEKKLSEFDLMIGGTPCTNLSRAGKGDGLKGEESKLFYDYSRILNYCKPKYFIFENVDNLLTINKGEDWRIVKEHLELNYNIYYKIINAKDLGIPQSRKRLFVVGIRKDIKQKFNFTNIKQTNKKKLLDILEPDAMLPILHNIYGGFKETKPRIFNEYSPTIRTAKGGGHIPSVCTTDESKIEKIIGEYKIRKLSPLECLRLMDFDDEDYYIMKEQNISNTQIYRMVGNSIVCRVLEEIFKQLLN